MPLVAKAKPGRPGRPVRAKLEHDEYIDEHLVVQKRRERAPLPPKARTFVEEEEYIDEFGTVRKGWAIRKKLLKDPPKDFEDIPLPPPPREPPLKKSDIGVEETKRPRPPVPRRGPKILEEDEYIEVDEITNERRVRKNRQRARKQGKPIRTTLEEDEWIDEVDIVREGWSKRDKFERKFPARPKKAKLAPDEYVDETGRIAVAKPRARLPPAARRYLVEDEYIDEYGVVRKGFNIRKEIEKIEPEKQLEVLAQPARSPGTHPPKARGRKRRVRRDRKFIEEDEYISLDEITQERYEV